MIFKHWETKMKQKMVRHLTLAGFPSQLRLLLSYSEVSTSKLLSAYQQFLFLFPVDVIRPVLPLSYHWVHCAAGQGMRHLLLDLDPTSFEMSFES